MLFSSADVKEHTKLYVTATPVTQSDCNARHAEKGKDVVLSSLCPPIRTSKSRNYPLTNKKQRYLTVAFYRASWSRTSSP